MTNTAEPDHGPVLNTTQARQGRRGRHVLWVLVIGLALVVAALFGTWLSQSDELAATDARANQAPAPAFDAPEPAPRVVDDAAPGASAYSGPDPQMRQ